MKDMLIAVGANSVTPERVGDWIQTYTGKTFYPLDPREEDVCIEDIAHAESLLCRFAGHVRTFYSVAEHSRRVADLVATYTKDKTMILQALIHDAPEAYLVDIPRPLKYAAGMENYRLYERDVENVIFAKYGVPLELPEDGLVKMCDKIMLLTEQRDLMGKQIRPWRTDGLHPLDEVIEPLYPHRAEEEFLNMFYRLTKEIDAQSKAA